MLDLIIRGGQVVAPWGVGEWDVAVQGEKIVAVAAPGTLTEDAVRIIDASGKVVVPGGIEPHAHIAAPIMGQGDLKTAPPEQVSRAALFGGTTTLLDFAIQFPGTDVNQAIQERTSVWKGKSYSDYAHHLMLCGALSDNMFGQLGEAVEDGFSTFKIFTTNVRPASSSGEPRMVRMGHLHDLMERVQRLGAMLMVHSEDDDMVQHMYEKLAQEERTEWWNMHLVHSNESEDVSIRRVLRVSEWTGSPVYFVHVSAKQGLEAIQEARAKGMPVYGETLHNYCCFNSDDYKEEYGMKYHTYPSLKSEEDRRALWDGIVRGGLSTMATDEYCTSWKVKVAGKLVSNVTGGHNGAETRLGITYSEGVSKRGMSLQRFVDVTSANAAKIMGLYPRKGVIAPGSDADIVFIDPGFKRPLAMSDFHITDYSIWEGFDVAGWPVLTILRGKVVVENGELKSSLGSGKFIPRKVDPEFASRPAC
ncbi:MAG: amidohydrolase family protein [Dehalococcoidia bacterium]|jgi:dihydropyrimidinase|nr:amidohydrolase family protein [Dehalococcoidia bacterium]MDP7083265.1 amidohydrolase family protein [Dehalococcoidia bacterium]MDP7200709.1 amidohydrolase family protein [Dehalococcoidia bacterium]MDP7510279.1 amidohydrolase family protein [Dehalococcoidia bacterium]HJN87776.1 amidohydrolase family protein [Dehalococcoidia bacterium]